MNLVSDSLGIAIRALASRKIRSFLTILGIVIGVTTIAGLLALALGVRGEITRQVESLGSNLVAVVPGQIRTAGGGLNPAASIGASTLTERDFEKIRGIPRVQKAAMMMLVSGTIHVQEKTSATTLIFAATPDILATLNTEVENGRFISTEDVEMKRGVVVLAAEPRKALFGDAEAVNAVVDIRGEPFRVIGTLAEKPSAINFLGPSFNDVVIMPITTGWDITGTKQIFRIMMQAPDSESVNEIRDRVRTVLLENHGGEEDFTVLTQEEILGLIGKILNILTAMLAAIAAISLLVGGIGIMNIMLVTESERTREIGIRKAVGATNRHILVQFLIEAVLLSFMGGIIGTLIAITGSIMANRYSPIPVDLPPTVILLALGFSLVVGVLFGVTPALRAARKDPIEALRSE
ncbi:MAG: ABC transporter permease [Parcubacteria group bacterium]|nr:ABC transporter permease [Parcubacteria group bacterium]